VGRISELGVISIERSETKKQRERSQKNPPNYPRTVQQLQSIYMFNGKIQSRKNRNKIFELAMIENHRSSFSKEHQTG
jgi:hypothetical protein